MPELPEVEVLVRHLDPTLRGKIIHSVQVRRPKVIAPTSSRAFGRALLGAVFAGVSRRGKYLVFALRQGEAARSGGSVGARRAWPASALVLLGHLGMTGRMYLLRADAPLPKHAAVVMDLGRTKFVFEDTRYFGRLTLDSSLIERLGPEPLSDQFKAQSLLRALKRSKQPIKTRLLDQALVAGIGNIYASEALFRAQVAPTLAARDLTAAQVARLWRAIRAVLREAISLGATVPLNYAGTGRRDGLFYYGRAPGAADYYEERLRVYDRVGLPCSRCRTPIQRLVQAGRSTYYCPRCQG